MCRFARIHRLHLALLAGAAGLAAQGQDPEAPPADAMAFEEVDETPDENQLTTFFKTNLWQPAEELGSSWSFKWREHQLDYAWKNLFRTNSWIQVPVEYEETRLRGTVGWRARVEADVNSGSGDRFGFEDGPYIRNARIYTNGSYLLGLPTDYNFEFGMETGNFVLTEFFLWFREVPFASNVKVGNFKAPIGLERLTSSYSETFSEISAPTAAFSPGYKFGVENRYTSGEKDLAFAVGLYGDTAENADLSDATGSLARFMGRLTWLPAYVPGAKKGSLTHIGLSGSYIFSDDESIRFRTRPESNRAPFVLDTGDIRSSHSTLVGLELATQSGPVLLQTELFGTWVGNVEDPSGGAEDLYFWGGYLRATCFLTGEQRRYNLDRGVFTKPEPKEPFGLQSGLLSGAWEVGGRVSYTDLDDGVIAGGKMGAAAAELNWYWSQSLRWQLYYAYADYGDGPGTGSNNAVEARFELDF